MLYDILMIDDVFENEKFFTVMRTATPADSGAAPSEHKNDMGTLRLLHDWMQKNFRVTWTTGEDDDLKKFGGKDLSAIRHIFCDLHLKGINKFTPSATINSKIIGIIGKLSSHFSNKTITLFINSGFYSQTPESGYYGEEDKQKLQNALQNQFEIDFKVDVVRGGKNAITDKLKRELSQHSMDIYIKTIISKAVEVENALSEKLRLGSFASGEISLHQKKWVFRSQFEARGVFKKIELLQQIRNELAHRDVQAAGFVFAQKVSKEKREAHKQCFMEVMGNGEIGPVQFNAIEDIAKYVKSIDKLVEECYACEAKPPKTPSTD